ncbi:MAG: YfdX family protein [Deltaproteobacteria bacterium]|nr:YfdX family protein [Deltaproteobacteria bacterium]
MKKRFFVVFLAVTMLLGAGFSQWVLGDETIKEEVSVSPGKPLSFPQQERIATLAVKALKHIAKARGFIHTHNFADARGELAKSQKLMEIIRASLPTTRIKDHIWVAKKHLSYEDSEEVIPDLVPIYASLDGIQSFVTVDKTRKHLDEAKKALKAGDKKKGTEALALAGESLVYVEIDLPLRYTERKVAKALHLLADGKGKEADQVLKEAEDGVQVISISSYGPMVLAQESLWQATKDYAKGRYEAAKRSLADAKVFLKMAAVQADEKTQDALSKLNRQIDGLEKKMAESGTDFSKEIKSLWNKTKDVYHETVEKFK